MAVDVGKLREYLRLSPDSTDDLSVYLAAAKSKARAAGIPDYKSNAHYDLFLLSLATMYYENRGMSFAASGRVAFDESAARLINSFVLELRHAREDPVPEPKRPRRPKGGK